jgi:hypothetical protein
MHEHQRNYIELHWRSLLLAGGSVAFEHNQPAQEAIAVAMRLCERSVDATPLWFVLLDHFFLLQRDCTALYASDSHTHPLSETVHYLSAPGSSLTPPSSEARDDDVYYVGKLVAQELQAFAKGVLSGMMNHVPLPAILAKITRDQQKGEFREFRETITSMLEAYAYEQRTLKATNVLLSRDVFTSIQTRRRSQQRALSTKSLACGQCGVALSNLGAGNLLSVYNCGHAFHEDCLGRTQAQCPLCQREASKGGEAARKRDSIRSLARGRVSTVGVLASTTSEEWEDERRRATRRPVAGDAKSKEYMFRLQLAERRNYNSEHGGLERFGEMLRGLSGPPRGVNAADPT